MKYLGLFVFVLPLFWLQAPVATANVLNEEPADFYRDGAGGWYGTTVSGKQFTQKIVENSEDIRLQRFAIGTTSYYISDQGVIWADSNLQAISIYLSRQA